jgi:serine/threonine protein phosphatase 1
MGLSLQERWSAKISYPPAPDGRTIYAVGDVHGRLDLLEKVQRRIDEDRRKLGPTRAAEVYLGDYIDRGPDSAGVISNLIERGRRTEAVFLRGNHEQVLLDFIEGESCLEEWRTFGGIPTLLSYHLDPALLARDVPEDKVRAALNAKLSGGHRQFYAATGRYCDAAPYLFVHAGIRPEIKLADQSLMDLLTIRTAFLDFGGDFGRIVVHGHTPVEKPDMRPNRINVDTGAFATHRLTCLKIDERGAQILTD